jgi:hypothetical protein
MRTSAYSPNLVEGVSLLKNPLGARFDPGSGTNRAGFGAFGARFAGAIGPMPTFSTGWGVLRSSFAKSLSEVRAGL